ncbi:MAG: metal-sensing transcriptional repressor [Spirulinaceae cyanobacterium]
MTRAEPFTSKNVRRQTKQHSEESSGLRESSPQTHAHKHVHSEESLRKIVNRLSRIEGHIRGVKTRVSASSPCPEVLIQIAAVRGALDRVARIIFDEHLSECITRAVEDGNIDTEIEELKAALDRFLP